MSSASKPLPTLPEALNFTDADLVANRAGELSDAQQDRLRRIWRRTLGILVVSVIGIGLAATIILYLAQRNESSVLTLVGIVLTVVNALVVGIGAQSYLRTSSDLRGGSIVEISGVVSHTMRVSGRVATYVLRLDGQEVIVPRPVFFAVEEGKRYRLYRAPATRTLLAAEPG